MSSPPLGLRQGYIDVQMQQNLISRLVSVKYSKIGINEALEFMNSILLEAVWKALFVYFYHARLTQACGVMAQLMLSATLGAWLLELQRGVMAHLMLSATLWAISGAADQDVEDSFSGDEVMPLEKI